jgi:hypothetical protein
MRLSRIVITQVFVGLLAVCLYSESAVAEDTLAQSVGLFVYPGEDQSAEQQSRDDSECFSWAKGQTGYDPVNPPQTQVAEADSGPDGSRARGAVRGGLAGAAVDEYREDRIGGGNQVNERYGDDHNARDAGAVIGAARGGSRSRRDRRQDQEEAGQQAAAASGEELDGFKKAFGACLTGRDYSVQY